MVKDELNLKLLRAIEDRDLEEAQEAIDLGANVNEFAVANGFSIGPNAKGETFMREEDALENGGTLEHFKVKRPFLIHAIEQEDLRMINLLLANGAKIDCEEIKTYTDGPNVGTEIKTTLKSALESNGLDIKKSLIGGKAKVTISKKLIKDAKKILKNQKMEKMFRFLMEWIQQNMSLMNHTAVDYIIDGLLLLKKAKIQLGILRNQ